MGMIFRILVKRQQNVYKIYKFASNNFNLQTGMSRFWPFRSLPNFLLSVVGVSGASFYGYGVYQQQYFQNPVVAEAVKVLGKNQKVKQMIGYPMSYQSSTKNKFNQTGNQLYFSFKVMGPRGATEVEVTATQMKAKDVYEYDNEVLPIKAAEAKYEELNKQLTLLQKEPIAKTNSISSWFKGNKQKQGYVSSDVLLRKQKQVEQAKRAVDQLINERKTRKNQYFIPQQQYYSQIVSQKGKDNSNYLPENALLYKLQNVACQLPNKSRINVLNSGKAYKAEDYETKIDEKNHFNDLRKPLYGPLHQKLSINVAELSDQEIDQYSKHKTNFMYQKYNQYRVLAFMVFMIGSGAIFLYILKNKTKSMSNSVLYQLASLKLSKHNKIGQFLKKNGIKQMQLDKNVAGGMKNNVFKCQIAVNNVTMGKLQIEGKHNAKAGSYDYDKFIFRYVQNNQHKQIDLLK